MLSAAASYWEGTRNPPERQGYPCYFRGAPPIGGRIHGLQTAPRSAQQELALILGHPHRDRVHNDRNIIRIHDHISRPDVEHGDVSSHESVGVLNGLPQLR